MLWKGQELRTHGEKFDAALKCSDEEAPCFFAVYALDSGGADVARANLGYMAGYYSEETRRLIEQKFGAVHPIFGSATPSAEEAYELGKAQGRQS